jgi:hypothetical protein
MPFFWTGQTKKQIDLFLELLTGVNFATLNVMFLQLKPRESGQQQVDVEEIPEDSTYTPPY